MILFVTTNICCEVVLPIVEELFATEHTSDVVVKFSGDHAEIIDTHFMEYQKGYPKYTDIVFLVKGEKPAINDTGGNLMEQSVTALYQQGGNIYKLTSSSGEHERGMVDPQKIPLVLRRVLQQYKEKIG